MALTYLDLQNEVKRRATRNDGGQNYDTAIKNSINSSLFRIAREALWRQLRRKTYITTKTSYTTGSGAVSVTSAGTTVNVTGATFITDGIEVGRRVKISNDSTYHIIRQVTGETSFVMDSAYAATSHTTATYEILPQEQYNLPLQCGHKVFLWHEEYGSPLQMEYIPDQEFYYASWNLTQTSVPIYYRMWSENMLIKDILTPTSFAVFSSDSDDTNIDISIFGTVEGYPDYEVIRNNGVTVTTGSKTFSDVDRVVKGSSSYGRISVTASGDTSIVYSVLPVGDTTAGLQRRKIQVYPLPNTEFDINVYFYKEPLRLVNDNDVHELGQEFDEAIILLSVSKIKGEDGQNETSTFYALYKDEISSLKKTNSDKIDWFPKLHRPYRRGNDFIVSGLKYSQLGANYGPSRRY